MYKEKTKVKLKSYSGDYIPVLGEMIADVRYEDQSHKLPLIVARGEDVALLGRNWMQSVKLNWKEIFSVSKPEKPILKNPKSDVNFKIKNLEKLKKVLDKFPDVFEPGLGPIQGKFLPSQSNTKKRSTEEGCFLELVSGSVKNL